MVKRANAVVLAFRKQALAGSMYSPHNIQVGGFANKLTPAYTPKPNPRSTFGGAIKETFGGLKDTALNTPRAMVTGVGGGSSVLGNVAAAGWQGAKDVGNWAIGKNPGMQFNSPIQAHYGDPVRPYAPGEWKRMLMSPFNNPQARAEFGAAEHRTNAIGEYAGKQYTDITDFWKNLVTKPTW